MDIGLIKMALAVVTCLSITLSGMYYVNHLSNFSVNHIKKLTRTLTIDVSSTRFADEYAQSNYSIISASVPDFLNDTNLILDGKPIVTNTAWGYLFQLPLTALAWNRLGIKTVAMLTVNYDKIHPDANRLLRLVDKTLRRLNVTVVYFDVPSNMKVRLGQVLRLVGGELGLFNDDDYLITSDADLWPIEPKRFVINPGKKIYITNSMCCGEIMYNDRMYREYPLSHIVMTVKLWKTIFNGSLIRSNANQMYDYADIQPLLHKLERFANDSNFFSPARSGDGVLWYLDQRYASVLIGDYFYDVDNSTAQFEKYLTCKRFYVRDWGKLMNMTFKCVSDAHVFKDHGWSKDRWRQMKQLTIKLYDSKTLEFLENYKRLFAMVYEDYQ